MSTPEVPELQSVENLTAQQASTAPEIDPRDEVEYRFEFEHVDSRGKRWVGSFVNKILTLKQRRQMKITKAQLGGGLSVAALDADVWEQNEMIAHLAISLDHGAKGFPDWAKSLEDLHDISVIEALYAEVVSHETRFFRRAADTEESSQSS